MKRKPLGSITPATFWAIGIGLLIVASAVPCHAQSLPPLRGVYTPGFNATNSGVMPEPGLTYSNTFMDYSFDQVNCRVCGNISSTFNASVLVDVNVFMWVSKKKILGANFGLVAGLPITNSALSLAGLRPIAGGGGFADSFYQPVTLGWHLNEPTLWRLTPFSRRLGNSLPARATIRAPVTGPMLPPRVRPFT